MLCIYIIGQFDSSGSWFGCILCFGPSRNEHFTFNLVGWYAPESGAGVVYLPHQKFHQFMVQQRTDNAENIINIFVKSLKFHTDMRAQLT